MNRTSSTLLLQAMLYLTNYKPPALHNLNVTLLHPSIQDPYMENSTLKCYGMYGCFSIITPWKDTSRPVNNFPEHPAKVDPGFCLLTRYNLNECQYLDHTNRTTIYRSFFTPFHKTYFIVHGFLESGDRPWMKNMAARLLKLEDCNVILIDWGKGSVPPYTQAVANIRLVGRITAFLIHTMKVITNMKTENVHVIGHSLGAHLSGYTGNTLKEYFNSNIGRITGMDPAEPHFSKTDPLVRLDDTDALYVDIIHTNAKPFINGGLGMDEPIGHLDFYPNGGDNQPGCSEGMMKFMKQQNQSMFHGVRKFLSCDHVRSHEFLLESIDSSKCTFLSIQCNSWEEFLAGDCFPCRSKENPNGYFCANMGLPSINEWRDTEFSKSTPIKLYTITKNEIPFCATLYRVTLNISNSSESILHRGEIGIFYISIIGDEGSTENIEVFKERYFAPGSSHRHVIGGTNVGNLTSATLYWEHPTTVNFFTWRIDPTIYIGSVTIETFADNQRLVLCPLLDQVLGSKRSMKMKTCDT